MDFRRLLRQARSRASERHPKRPQIGALLLAALVDPPTPGRALHDATEDLLLLCARSGRPLEERSFPCKAVMPNLPESARVGRRRRAGSRDPARASPAASTSASGSEKSIPNTRRKTAGGEWEDKPNFFDVTVWGARGEACAEHLTKGSPAAIDGRLEWREWEAQDGAKWQAVTILAASVQFLSSRDREAASA